MRFATGHSTICAKSRICVTSHGPWQKIKLIKSLKIAKVGERPIKNSPCGGCKRLFIGSPRGQALRPARHRVGGRWLKGLKGWMAS